MPLPKCYPVPYPWLPPTSAPSFPRRRLTDQSVGGFQDAWDKAEDASYLAGFPFKDRHGKDQNTEGHKSYVARVLADMLAIYPEKSEKVSA